MIHYTLTLFKLTVVSLLYTTCILGQSTSQNITKLTTEINQLDSLKAAKLSELEELRLTKIIKDLKELGLPTNDYIEHKAMILSYSEEHEQAQWVSHIILPEIKNGAVFRSNDFREDPLVTTGTAIQEDYFLTDTLLNGKVNYDGFGYDRGHLAPSADFRWSAQSLSESYFYSNMSPQNERFNRGIWVALENTLRAYVVSNNVPLYIITAPILADNLPHIEKSLNKVSIPNAFIKLAVDLENKHGIGFVIPNEGTDYPLSTFVKSISEIEKIVDMDFYPLLKDTACIEKCTDPKLWLPDIANGDVTPIYQPNLPPHHFNTVVGARKKGNKKRVTVCGKVVSKRFSRSGNLWMNLDKQFPNEIFSVYIKKKDLVNFSFDASTYLLNKELCFKGKVADFSGTATMNIKHEKDIDLDIFKDILN